MNKRLLFLFIILFSACGTFVPLENRQISGTYDLPGLSRNTIFDKTIVWAASSYKTSKPVIEYQDREKGTIVGNGKKEFLCETGYNTTSFSFIMQVEDNRITVTYKNFYVESSDTGEYEVTDYETLSCIRDELVPVTENLINYLQQKNHQPAKFLTGIPDKQL